MSQAMIRCQRRCMYANRVTWVFPAWLHTSFVPSLALHPRPSLRVFSHLLPDWVTAYVCISLFLYIHFTTLLFPVVLPRHSNLLSYRCSGLHFRSQLYVYVCSVSLSVTLTPSLSSLTVLPLGLFGVSGLILKTIILSLVLLIGSHHTGHCFWWLSRNMYIRFSCFCLEYPPLLVLPFLRV